MRALVRRPSKKRLVALCGVVLVLIGLAATREHLRAVGSQGLGSVPSPDVDVEGWPPIR